MSSSADRLVLALPSKGQLHDSTLRFLEAAGLPVQRTGNAREYTARLGGVVGADVIFFRADEIPERVERASVHLGVTGEDLFRENGDGRHRSYMLVPDLGFGRARLVVAVPRAWVDVSSITDLEDVAMLYRQAHGRSLRVATKFARLTREFFAAKGITDYRIVESLGATEGSPAAGSADLIVDLTSTGTTLAQNHLKEIADGTVLVTQGCLIAALEARSWPEAAVATMQQIVEQLEAHLRAKSTAMLRFTASVSRTADISQELSLRYQCEVRGSAFIATSHRGAIGGNEPRGELTALCSRAIFYNVVKYLREMGCPDVTVEPCQFVFRGESSAVDGFRRILRRHSGAGGGREPIGGTPAAAGRQMVGSQATIVAKG